MLTKKELDDLTEYYKLKAYYIEVDDNRRGEGEVVFAKSVEEAKQQAWRIGAREYSAEDIDKVERKPEYDKYADLGYLPLQEKFEDGWWGIECDWCGREISESALDNYEE